MVGCAVLPCCVTCNACGRLLVRAFTLLTLRALYLLYTAALRNLTGCSDVLKMVLENFSTWAKQVVYTPFTRVVVRASPSVSPSPGRCKLLDAKLQRRGGVHLLLGGVPWSYNIRCGRGARGCRPSAPSARVGSLVLSLLPLSVMAGAVGGWCLVCCESTQVGILRYNKQYKAAKRCNNLFCRLVCFAV